VRHWRIAAGLTQTAVAKRSGMNRSYLSRLESGRRNPTLATLERLAKTLKVTPGTFFEDVSARRRRTKHSAALSSGCKSHPASAPAGSNRSSYGGNEVAEAFG